MYKFLWDESHHICQLTYEQYQKNILSVALSQNESKGDSGEWILPSKWHGNGRKHIALKGGTKHTFCSTIIDKCT